MKNSYIEWTTNTFNPWEGCSQISPGCANCYAKTLCQKRFKRVTFGTNTPRRRTSAANWKQPLAWNRKAAKTGNRTKVFCASLCDVFEDHPQVAPWRDELHGLIAVTPNLDWQLLTKRPHIAAQYYKARPLPPNVWVGTSVENQEYAELRIPQLLQIPAAIHFLSCEPLLGPVDLQPWLGALQWVIVGGESGIRSRPMDNEWVTDLRDQCVEAHVPFFFKQWGGVQKKKNGKELDGRTWTEFPTYHTQSNHAA